jgi:enoyl-[acyl-carrier protein] reductase III
MSNHRNLALSGWALVLGASSGFGAAAALAFAKAGCDIVGVHLDRRSTLPQATQVADSIRNLGREAWFHNVNAADQQRCAQVLDDFAKRVAGRADKPSFSIVLHSLAFGSLLPFIDDEPDVETSPQQLNMTMGVMAHSLVAWTQELVRRSMIGEGCRIFAMTSAGSTSVWRGYGAVSAAKAALESHVRQLACELAPRGITVNAVRAGVADTPALRKIPSHQAMVQVALRKNPHRRLTTPVDVANALVALAQPETYWMTGNVIGVDGGESIAG